MAKTKSFELVMPFDSEDFIEVWELWLDYRTQIKKPYKTDISIQLVFKKLSQFPEQIAIQMILQSIEHGWQGIFSIKDDYKKASKVDAFAQEAIRGRDLLKKMQDNDRSS